MNKNPTFLVTYTGEGVVSLARVGLFQTGTMAVVGAEEAEKARAQGQFQVRQLGDPAAKLALRPPPARPVTPVTLVTPPAPPVEPPAPEVIDFSPPAPPFIPESPAVTLESHASEPVVSAPSEEAQPAAALGGETSPSEDADASHESHDDGEAATSEDSGGEGASPDAPPRRKSRRR